MLTKQHILKSIRALAKRLGRAPTLLEFVSSAGTSRHSVLRFFPKWNDAVRAARLRPCTLFVKLDDSELLKDWGETVRSKQGLPSWRGYLVAGKFEPRTLEKRFGGWTSVPRAFRNFAKGKAEWADVLALLPAPDRNHKPAAKRSDSSVVADLQVGSFGRPLSAIPPHKVQHAPLQNRLTYGNPIDFRGLRHEPVNEQGVVLLFGMLAKELGYMIEAVQNGFPDCEAKRQIAPGRWQRVQIEFEFESRNFRDHGHPVTGCDVIVCWRHNWPECPQHIEVVELSSIIKSLAHSGD